VLITDADADAGMYPDDMAGLLQRAATGCQPSFERLYQTSRGRLFSVILRINNDHGEAEEVLQETYLKVWHQCAWYDASKGLASSWLASIARNCAIDSLRRHLSRPQRASLSAELEDCYAWFHSPDISPLESLELRRRAASVQSCLRTLPPEQRESLMLAFYSGLSQVEIASQLGCPLGSVKSRLRRGMRGLKVALKTEG
jgi:RNA polymerase sigma-70 factor (ECF subfamily)